MTYDVYMAIFYISIALSGVMLVLSVLFFFLLRIPKVIGDLTGRTAKHAIESMRQQNEKTGDKTYKSSAVNRERGRITDRISPSGSLHSREADSGGAMATSKIGVDDSDNTTELISPSENATTILNAPIEDAPTNPEAAVFVQPSPAFAIVQEITFAYSDVIIE